MNPLPSPYEPAAPSRCRQTVKFLGGLAEGSTYEGTDSVDGSRLNVDKALQEALKIYGGCSSSSPVDFNSKEAETEVVVSVLEKPIPWYTGVLGKASLRSLCIIPIYSGHWGWTLSYSVYDHNALKKTYKYEITAKPFCWLFLLPFSWINFFTYSLEDAVRSTTAQYVVDAQRDGYLGTEN